MNNAEMLLFGGANPYANATHWLTVEYVGEWGFFSGSSANTGAIEPGSLMGYNIYWLYSTASETRFAFYNTAGDGPASGMYEFSSVTVTRLDNNQSTTLNPVTGKGEFGADSSVVLFSAADDGKKIPLIVTANA